jgi:hypothetical protein
MPDIIPLASPFSYDEVAAPPMGEYQSPPLPPPPLLPSKEPPSAKVAPSPRPKTAPPPAVVDFDSSYFEGSAPTGRAGVSSIVVPIAATPSVSETRFVDLDEANILKARCLLFICHLDGASYSSSSYSKFRFAEADEKLTSSFRRQQQRLARTVSLEHQPAPRPLARRRGMLSNRKQLRREKIWAHHLKSPYSHWLRHSLPCEEKSCRIQPR